MLANGLFSGLSTTAFFICLGLFLVLIAGGGFAFYLFHMRAKMMAETPTYKIRTANSGYVEFEGRVKAMSASTLKGALTGTPCAWYEYEITKQMGGHGSDSHSQWVNVDKAKSDQVFWLVDETGQCLIDPQGANVITAPKQTDRWLGRTARPTSGPAKRGSRLGLFPGQGYTSFNFGNGLWFSTRRNYRYMERRIPEGASLYIIGQFKKMGNEAGAGNASVSELLRRWKSNQQEILDRFDSDGDGHIDVDEWGAARKAAEREVRQQEAQTGGNEVSILGATGDRSKPFLISAIPQSELLGRYRLLRRLGVAAAISGTLMLGLLIAGR